MRSGGSWINCSSTSWRGEVFAGGPAARRPAFRSSKPKPKPKQRLPDTSGRRRAWPCRTRRKPLPGGSMAPSMAPTVLHGHALRPWTRSCERGAYMRGGSPLVAANLGWQQLLTLLFSFDFEFPLSFRALETVRSRSKAAGRTVRRMDAPTEPTGTYLRRVLPVALLRLYARKNEAPRTTLLLRILPPAVGILPWPQFDGRQQRRRWGDAAQCQGHGSPDAQRLEVRAE